MEQVRIGIIGLGNMGSAHAKYMNSVAGAKLTAVADHEQEKIDRTLENLGDEAKGVRSFAEGSELIEKGEVDAVLIATPHYDHPTLAMQAFDRGLHVLCEKPVAVTAKAAAEVNDKYRGMSKKPVYGAMFQQRTSPQWKEVKRMIDAGDLGEIKRVSWIITDWYRSQIYYDSGGWRATWAGEGGGVLINQCPHNLDLLQWFVGMPNKVTSIVGLGKHHRIEVDDDVTAILEYANGATGTFITTTGDSPGTNRLEITGDRGKLVAERGLTWFRNHQPTTEHLRTTDQAFGKVPCDKHTIELGGKGEGHKTVTQNFVNAILHDEPLIAEATEGINGLELGNAMLMSGVTGRPIEVPTPRDEFDQLIQKLAAESTFSKPKETKQAKVDISSSF